MPRPRAALLSCWLLALLCATSGLPATSAANGTEIIDTFEGVGWALYVLDVPQNATFGANVLSQRNDGPATWATALLLNDVPVKAGSVIHARGENGVRVGTNVTADGLVVEAREPAPAASDRWVGAGWSASVAFAPSRVAVFAYAAGDISSWRVSLVLPDGAAVREFYHGTGRNVVIERSDFSAPASATLAVAGTAAANAVVAGTAPLNLTSSFFGRIGPVFTRGHDDIVLDGGAWEWQCPCTSWGRLPPGDYQVRLTEAAVEEFYTNQPIVIGIDAVGVP